MCEWLWVCASCFVVSPLLYLVRSPTFVAGLKSNWVILQLGCNNVHCDTRGGGGLLTRDDQKGKGSMTVRVSGCFPRNVFVCLGSLGIHTASCASGVVCLYVPLTVTSRVDLSYQCTWAQIFFFVFIDLFFVCCCSHDVSSDICSMH